MAALSKPWIYGRSLARTAGSNPAGAWMTLSFECCLLSDRGLCDRPIKGPTKCVCVRVCVCVCVCVCDRGNSQKRLRSTMSCCDMWGRGENAIISAYIYI